MCCPVWERDPLALRAGQSLQIVYILPVSFWSPVMTRSRQSSFSKHSFLQESMSGWTWDIIGDFTCKTVQLNSRFLVWFSPGLWSTVHLRWRTSVIVLCQWSTAPEKIGYSWSPEELWWIFFHQRLHRELRFPNLGQKVCGKRLQKATWQWMLVNFILKPLIRAPVLC